MLAWHNSWMASHGKDMAREMQAVGGAVAAGRRPLAALAIVVGVAVLREGSEIVLFLYGIASAGGESAGAMVLGGIFGILCGAGLSGLMYFGLVAIPMRRLFAVTTALITLLAAGMASQAVAFLQQAGYFSRLADPLWDTSGLLSESSLLGRLLHSLIGYSDSPTGAQLIAYLATIAVIVVLMRLVGPRRTPAPGPLAKTTPGA
jgi:high-affinity iron transporter